jgi:hypothetical protein
VNKHVLAVLTADEAKTLGIVKPLYCSLFHCVDFLSTDEFAARSKSGIDNYKRRRNQSDSNDV